jgi:hypothetical protein
MMILEHSTERIKFLRELHKIDMGVGNDLLMKECGESCMDERSMKAIYIYVFQRCNCPAERRIQGWNGIRGLLDYSKGSFEGTPPALIFVSTF